MDEDEVLGRIRTMLEKIGERKETYEVLEVDVVGVQDGLRRYRLFRKNPGEVDRAMCSHPDAHTSAHEAESCDEASVKLRRADQEVWARRVSSRAALDPMRKISFREKTSCFEALSEVELSLSRIRTFLKSGGRFSEGFCDEDVLNLALLFMDFQEEEYVR